MTKGIPVSPGEWELRFQTIAPRWKQGQTLKQIAAYIGTTEASISVWLRRGREAGHAGIIEADAARAARTPPPPTRSARDLIEERLSKTFGMSVDELADSNIQWMRQNGYEHSMKTSTERERTRMLKERREAKSRRFG